MVTPELEKLQRKFVKDVMGGMPQCADCIHLIAPGRKCAAFPDGIPGEIRGGVHDHREPYEGDGGIRFEPRAGDVENGDG